MIWVGPRRHLGCLHEALTRSHVGEKGEAEAEALWSPARERLQRQGLGEVVPWFPMGVSVTSSCHISGLQSRREERSVVFRDRVHSNMF